MSLTPDQAVALLAAVSAAPDAPYSDLASVAVQKIMDALDPRTQVKVDELANRIWVNTDQSGTRAVRSALEEAMSEQQVVRICYTASDGNKTTRDVEPVIFASTNGHWNLIGWCQLRNEMRWFRVSRIERATVTRMGCGNHTVDEIGIPPVTSKSVHVQE